MTTLQLNKSEKAEKNPREGKLNFGWILKLPCGCEYGYVVVDWFSGLDNRICIFVIQWLNISNYFHWDLACSPIIRQYFVFLNAYILNQSLAGHALGSLSKA